MRTRIIKNNDGIPIPVIFQKAENSTGIDKNDVQGEYMEIFPDTPIGYLKDIAKESTIIPQCIKAYETNIAGFGVDIKSKLDDKIDSAEEKKEAEQLKNIIDNMNYDMPFKKVLSKIINYREQCGIAHMEVIRNNIGEVVETNALDPEFITLTSYGPTLEFEQQINGNKISRKKRFRKIKQMVNGKTVYYKEFGFPKFMDYRTGKITETDNGEYEANEVLVFRTGSELYGTPRWWGQAINIQGSKMAEFVNYNYFVEGRHTPIMIVVKGGTLSEKSWADLQTYMNDIKGYKNSHGFIVLEVEAMETGVQSLGLEDDKGMKIDVEIKDLSPMLQQDALFSGYLKENAKGIQSSFNLPDIYVGKTEEYNRATSYAAMEVTERQVFQPERETFKWVINNILLGGYEFKTVEVELKSPKLENTDDLFKMLMTLQKAGGVTPLVAQKLLQKYVDIDLEEYTESWGQIPIEVLKIAKQDTQEPQAGEIKKNEQRQVDVLKDVRNALIELTDKYNI